MKVIRENGIIVAYRHWGRWWWKPYMLLEFEAASKPQAVGACSPVTQGVGDSSPPVASGV